MFITYFNILSFVSRNRGATFSQFQRGKERLLLISLDDKVTFLPLTNIFPTTLLAVHAVTFRS